MASKNLKKVLRLTLGDDELMNTYLVNYGKMIKYNKLKSGRKAYNILFKKFYTEARAEGYGKKEAKEITKAKLKGNHPTQSGYKEQEILLPEA